MKSNQTLTSKFSLSGEVSSRVLSFALLSSDLLSSDLLSSDLLPFDLFISEYFLLILLATLSDALDGWVARKAREVTHFGKWIDPIADFVCIFSVVAYLTLIGKFPGWFFLFYLIRYVFIAISAIYFFSYAIFQIPAGLLIDRIGIKIISIAAF